MKRLYCLFLVAFITFGFLGCSNVSRSEQSEAKEIIQNYLSYITDGDYEKAYDLLSDYDKENFSKELYIKVRKEISRVIKFSDIELDSKIDSFKNYSYNGMRFDEAISLKVSMSQESLVKGYEPSAKISYRQMAVFQNDKWKIGLFVTDDNLKESLEKYKKISL